MENFFIYLAKSSVLIAVFYFCYYLFLSRETFFTHNRVFQLFGLLVAFVLPLLFITETVFVEPVLYDVISSAVPYTNVQVPQSIDWWLIMGVGYFAGVCVLFFKLIIQIFSLKRIISKNTCIKINGLIMVETNEKTSPFSFFNYIVYNPTMYSEKDLKTVIAHEKIHASEKHSLDLLLMHLLCIVQWFNPFAWLYKKAVGQNLEYIADHLTAIKSEDKKGYQYLLLDQSVSTSRELTIINPFFNSLIKKRIIMLNQKKSKRVNTLKFGLILPFLGLFLFLINTKTVAQTKSPNETVIREMKFEVVIDKNATNDELNAHSKFIKEQDSIDLKFFGIKRNSNNEIIRIESTFKAKDAGSGTLTRKGDQPIIPFTFYYEIDENKKLGSFGYGATKEIKKLEIDYVDLINEIEKNGNLSEATKEKLKRNLKKEFEVKAINAQETTVTSSINTINHTDEFGNKVVWNKSDLTNLSNPIFYVDGVEQGPKFDINSIGNIDTFRVLPNEIAIEKYDKTSESGIVDITTIPVIQEQSGWNVSAVKKSDIKDTDEDGYLLLRTLLRPDMTTPIVIVDGKNKGTSLNKIKIKTSKIESYGVWPPSQDAIERFGKKGKNGVIEIKTKKENQN